MSNSPLGLQSTIVVILIVFVSTAFFFWKVFTLTLHKSQDTEGIIGVIAKKSMRFSWLQKQAPVKVAPRARFHLKKMMNQAVEQKRREAQVENIQESSRLHKERLMMRIELSRSHRGARLKARLLARAKVKKANALQKCEVFASLDAKSISKIVDNMDYREIEGVICKKGDPAKELWRRKRTRPFQGQGAWQDSWATTGEKSWEGQLPGHLQQVSGPWRTGTTTKGDGGDDLPTMRWSRTLC